MSEYGKNMTCAKFQAQMPELVGSGESLTDHPHLQTCELCSALMADLETIADAARQLFPVTDPPDHLWAHIESAIKSDTTGDEATDKELIAQDETEKEAASPSSEGLSPEPA